MEFYVARRSRLPPAKTLMLVKRVRKHLQKTENGKHKFTSHKSAKFRGVCCSINFNSNSSAERKHASLQQNSKLHSKFKETNTKNIILLDSDSNAAITSNNNCA